MHAMSDQSRPSVPKWPFFLADALMLGLAWFVYSQSKLPLDAFAISVIAACAALGGLLGVMPFLLEYRITLKLAETEGLTSVVTQIQNLETIATHISQATGQWQTVQEHSSRTVAAAKDIGERMTAEAKAFGEFMRKANDTEKSTLRLEVEKLRRAEGDWLQVVIRMLDHTFALHAAAARTGKPGLTEQLAQFQNALRDSARRVGLIPFTPGHGETFDPAKHESSDPEKPGPGATVRETIATGYTFRGQLVRPALVATEVAAEQPPSTAAPEMSPVPEEQTLL
jgi:molecular chaperone GrpE (heat shock protein)